MPSGSVVTAKEYIEKKLERRGKRLEDAYLDRPVVLALPIFVRRMQAQDLATRVEHATTRKVMAISMAGLLWEAIRTAYPPCI